MIKSLEIKTGNSEQKSGSSVQPVGHLQLLKLETEIAASVEKIIAIERQIQTREAELKELNLQNLHLIRATGKALKEVAKVLKKADKALPGRKFTYWLEDNFRRSKASAYNYMTIDDVWDSIVAPRLPNITYKEAIAIAQGRGDGGSRRKRDNQKQELPPRLRTDLLKDWSGDERAFLWNVYECGLVQKEIEFFEIIRDHGTAALRRRIQEDMEAKQP